MYLHGRRLHLAYNFLGTETTVVSAEVDLPADGAKVTLRWRRR